MRLRGYVTYSFRKIIGLNPSNGAQVCQLWGEKWKKTLTTVVPLLRGGLKLANLGIFSKYDNFLISIPLIVCTYPISLIMTRGTFWVLTSIYFDKKRGNCRILNKKYKDTWNKISNLDKFLIWIPRVVETYWNSFVLLRGIF